MSLREFQIEVFNPMRDLTFIQARTNAVASYGMLALPADNLARSSGNPDNSLALIHRGQSLRLLAQGVEKFSVEKIDGLMHAVTLMVAFEVGSTAAWYMQLSNLLLGFQGRV